MLRGDLDLSVKDLFPGRHDTYSTTLSWATLFMLVAIAPYFKSTLAIIDQLKVGHQSNQNFDFCEGISKNSLLINQTKIHATTELFLAHGGYYEMLSLNKMQRIQLSLMAFFLFSRMIFIRKIFAFMHKISLMS